MEIVDQTTVTEEKEKEKRIEYAKKKFAQNNSFKDFTANSKPHSNAFKIMNMRPVIENEHDSYMKTHLMFMEKPKNTGPSSSDAKMLQKQYYDKHIDTVTRKIEELGGMEDTVAKM